MLTNLAFNHSFTGCPERERQAPRVSSWSDELDMACGGEAAYQGGQVL